jgi:hypothetical protein
MPFDPARDAVRLKKSIAAFVPTGTNRMCVYTGTLEAPMIANGLMKKPNRLGRGAAFQGMFPMVCQLAEVRWGIAGKPLDGQPTARQSKPAKKDRQSRERPRRSRDNLGIY